MHLLDWFEDEVTHKGVTYSLDLDYFNVLSVLAVMEDEELTDLQRTYTALEMLLNVYELTPEDLEYTDAIELLNVILSDHISQGKEVEPELDIEGNPMKVHKSKASYDFLFDGPLIDASFTQAYNVDLFAKRGELHWRRFLALFEGLPEDTIMMQVIKIRQMPLPKGDASQAQAVAKLKHMYKLPDKGR